MKIFGTLEGKDYTVEEYYATSPISWELVSSSIGITINDPIDLLGAVTINRANKNSNSSTNYLNPDTGVYDYVLHASIKHLFYNNGNFISGSTLTTSSLISIPDVAMVVSIGQNFYGEQIKPGSFELSINSITEKVQDDGVGNLFISQSGTGSYAGNIFYEKGIAVIAENTSSLTATVGSNGIKIISGSTVYIDYESSVKNYRHQANIRLLPMDFNFSPFNPSILSTFTTISGSVTQSLVDKNVLPINGVWPLYDLMGSNIIKPYITTIGLYNDQYELLAVAKVSSPIQRTYDVEQIFVVRFEI